MTIALKIVAVLVGIYAILLIALSFGQRGLIYFPNNFETQPATMGPTDFTAVAISATRTTSWWKPPASSDDPVIIHFHGNASSLANAAPAYVVMARDGIGLLGVGYPGYNGDEGNPSETSFFAAARANYDWLIASGIAPARIVIVGQSIGSGPATWLASEKQAAGLILEAPFTSMADMAAKQMPFMPARWLVRDRFDNISRIGKIDMPLAWAHGTADRIIPMTMGADLFAKAAAPKCAHRIRGAGHNDIWAYDVGVFIRLNAQSMVASGMCSAIPAEEP